MSTYSRLALSGDRGGLDRLFAELARFAARCRVSDRVRRQMYVALDEVVANIVQHGHKGRRPADIRVRMGVANGMLEVRISDDGVAFNPLRAPDPRTDLPLAARPVGGLGLFIVKRLMDDVEYRRRNGRNYLVLRKALGRRQKQEARRA